MAFSICTELSITTLNARVYSTPPKETPTPPAVIPTSPSAPLQDAGRHQCTSCPHGLSVLDLSCKWNHAI